jgi:hypothetical protein
MKKKTAGFGAFTLLLALITVGCPSESPSDPKPAGEITITDIPTTIGDKQTYKIYVSLTDSVNYNDPHEAQGTALVDGKTSVTVTLYKSPPNANEHPDPDTKTGGLWSGKTAYFSVTISPEIVSSKNDIMAKAGMTFNDSKKTTSWNTLLDAISQDQLQIIYDWIICKDDAITHP